MIETKEKISEKVILIGLITQLQDEVKVIEYLDELEFLTLTAGGNTVKRFTQKLTKPNPKTFVGSGKLEEIKEYILANEEIGTAIFDDELSPGQLRNIENVLGCKVLDRTNLILDIFADRAQTSSAKAQVELAQYQYMLPRLAKLWSHLDKQKGGIGMRGPGETEIETDRRIVRDKITLLQNKLKTIDKQMSVQRTNRGKLVRVAIVGYTNVGKSTLMNVISKSDVFAENKLFATLDTTVRKVVVKNIPFLMADTVGFIRKLPTQLVESFKSTLDEVREADLLLHVVDISHPNFEDHVESVNKILTEIECNTKPVVMVYNKVDAYEYEDIIEEEQTVEEQTAEKEKKNYTLDDWKNSLTNQMNCKSIFISATNSENIDVLKELLYEEVKSIHIKRFPYNKFLYEDISENQ